MDRCSFRIGLGFDVHRFASNRPLVLGGVRIREHDGLEGHSDADVLTHAIIDALLGAAGLADIGTLFPDSDELYKGADSLRLLEDVVCKIQEAGWRIANIDSVVICEEPRIATHRLSMQERLAQVLGMAKEDVHIKGKTTEGLGFTGRKEGIAAEAVALLRSDGGQ